MVKAAPVALALAAASLLAAGCAADDDPVRARAGDCLEALGEGKKTTEFRIVGCGTPAAAYRVARRLTGGDRSCGGSTYGYVSSGYARGATRWHLCLTLNAQVGDCFHQEVGFPTGKATKTPCGPEATYKVVKVAEGTADTELCGEDAGYTLVDDLTGPIALVYRDPPLTICTDGVDS